MKRYHRYALAAFVSIAVTATTATTFAEERAQAAASHLKMDIMVNCRDGNAVFRVKNVGNAWPKTSTFAI